MLCKSSLCGLVNILMVSDWELRISGSEMERLVKEACVYMKSLFRPEAAIVATTIWMCPKWSTVLDFLQTSIF